MIDVWIGLGFLEDMMRCPTCQTANLESSRFCDECGSRLAAANEMTIAAHPAEPQITAPPAYVPPQPNPVSQPHPVAHSNPVARPVSVTSVGVPAMDMEIETGISMQDFNKNSSVAHAALVIERGDVPGTEFKLVNDESTIGRWDADNGIFPDVDLDAHDSDAKVSRRHARIVRNHGSYFVEDLGSTNGTYVNRGRRLLPGNPQALSDGDEVIVGKTFLRFQITH